jgi:hypothetical protein
LTERGWIGRRRDARGVDSDIEPHGKLIVRLRREVGRMPVVSVHFGPRSAPGASGSPWVRPRVRAPLPHEAPPLSSLQTGAADGAWRFRAPWSLERQAVAHLRVCAGESVGDPFPWVVSPSNNLSDFVSARLGTKLIEILRRRAKERQGTRNDLKGNFSTRTSSSPRWLASAPRPLRMP